MPFSGNGPLFLHYNKLACADVFKSSSVKPSVCKSGIDIVDHSQTAVYEYGLYTFVRLIRIKVFRTVDDPVLIKEHQIGIEAFPDDTLCSESVPFSRH